MIENYKNKICRLFTKHKYRELIGWEPKFIEENYRHPNQHKFYYRCKICGYIYSNKCPTQEEINYIKENK